ncbi:MAG TPA: deoxyribodipyrimidine photo-lyase [Acidobacteriaceae bacterium]|jgi:deoxyribodipyrimidine photo-lyase|nr:deoxyribodipyrimidine photo-lyase [Acidobacteriaceae bacterium]
MTDQSMESVLVWLRRDLRLADHPALTAAVATGLAVIPVYVWDPEVESAGAAARWWLHASLLRLDEALRARGSRLTVRRGPAAETLASLAAECGAQKVLCSRVYEPACLAGDRRVAARLRAEGVAWESLNGSLLFEPGSIRTTAGGSFQVFTPFWRACWNERGALRRPVAAPARVRAPERWPESLAVADLELEPQIDWAAGMRAAWTPGETAAQARLRKFAKSAVAEYGVERDRPDHDGTSRLSPHLHFGEISPVQTWHGVAEAAGAETYLRQLVWREFAHHLLDEHPRTLSEPFNEHFRHFPWRHNQRRLTAWQQGRTGYPYIDAAMRQLWATGWMHNRARMAVASFLVKHLLAPWQDGAAWFLDTLVDADLANNTMGWQWVAGCGVDAAPYFRIFNPVLQGEKFDPDGSYVRAWVPELREMPAEFIHQPWNAPPLALAAAGVRLGENYPLPMVDHAAARAGALAAYAEMRNAERDR